MKIIETKRLILRKPVIEDLEDFNYYSKKVNIGPMAGWSPHNSLAESEFILRDMIIKDEVWGVIYKENNKMIGTIGLHDTKNAADSRELGYVIDDEYWGKGITVEASTALLKYVFNNTAINMIYCAHFSQNLQSKRVIEKLGFNLYKIEPDERFMTYTDLVYYYKISKNDFLGRCGNE